MILQRLRLVALPCFCLVLFLYSKAQTIPSGYSITNYNSDNALPQNSINDMAFDPNGFLWLATEMGMVRFDGQHFREYNMANSPALYRDRCSLVKWAKGRILMEPAFASHRLLTVTADYRLQADSLLSAHPYQCNRWSNCIFYFDHIFKKWGGDATNFKGLLSDLPANGDLVTENERQAYVRKDSDCYYLDDNTAGVHLLSEIDGHAMKIQFMVGDLFFYVDRQNRFYAFKQGRWQKKIACGARLSEIFRQAQSGAYPSQYTVKAIRDTSHTFLVYKGNILLLNVRNGVLDFEVLASNTSIKDINCMIYDEVYRALYIGTATSGLYILRKFQFRQLAFTGDNYAINSLYAQVEISNGRIFTASGVLDPNKTVNIPAPGLYDQPGLLRSSDGYIWYSNYNYLKRIDTGLHHPVTVQYIDGWLMAITEISNKDILCGTVNKLFRVRGKDVTLLLNKPAPLQGANIQVLSEIHPNNCWIGTAAGLFSYDLVNNTLCRIGLPTASVRAIHKAADGSIWIGTYGQGFYKYDGRRFIKMPLDARNYLSTTHCFMEDKQGYFWLPTNKGLFRVARKELDSYACGNRNNVFYYYFDKTSGFNTNEFNGGCTPCGIVTRDGRFSLPSLDGLIQFNPDSISVVPPNHPVFIDRIVVNGKQVSADDKIEEKQDAGPLTFAISSPYFGNPANLHLEYSIPELDSKWHTVNDDGKLVLTGLHKGQYTLNVRKQERYGVYSYQVVRWTILPWWYETVGFRLLIAVIIIGALTFIFWLRYIRQVNRATLLEQKVAERTQALSESNTVKQKMIAIILHDLRSPLRFLHLLADHIAGNYQKTSGPELANLLVRFRNATLDLNEFAQDFLVWTNAQKEGFVVQQERIVLCKIVDEIVSLYEPATNISNNTVLNQVPASVTLVSDPHILKLIIRNLVDNANKYTINGEIKMEAVHDASTIRIIITDTGRSMGKDRVAEIFSNANGTHDASHGFGYRIIFELLGKINGTLAIDAPGDTGNRITLAFPIGGE